MTTSKRHHKGQVTIITSNGWLQLRFSYQGKRHYLSLGLKENQKSRKLAEAKAKLIESDIAYERLDLSLEKYQNKAKSVPISSKIEQHHALDKLWNDYVAFRTSQVSETTLRLNYARVSSHLSKLPAKTLDHAEGIKNFLIKNSSAYTAKRVLTQINACCNWAVKNGLIPNNPFTASATEIKLGRSHHDINPFTPSERDSIIEGFERHPSYRYYADFVRFLFFSGARTSEAVALRWKDIDPKFNHITFSQAVVNASGRRIRKECKTGKSRKFPCNQQLKELLVRVHSERFSNHPEANLHDLVFPSLSKKEINAHTFNALCWKGTTVKGVYRKGIVTKLVEQGLVSSYRPQYNTRHTFITYCLEAGISVTQIASWVGNSSEIIMKHYAGIIKQVEVPEF